MKKINKFLLPVVTAFLITAPFAVAQTTPSGIQISELEPFVDSYVSKYIGVKTTGASIAVLKDGEVMLNKAYGYAIQDEIAAEADSVFEWGSATKLLVWTSVMQLAEQGRLDLNRDIREYLPDSFLKKLKYETPVTMYNLMHHNAGWEDRIVEIFYKYAKDVPGLEKCLLAYEPAQIYPPGTIVAYSNFAVATAGYIVQRITGRSFYEYVWENIFEPLGMKDTSIHPLQTDNPSVAEKRNYIKGYNPGKERPVLSPSQRIYIGLYPAGSVIGTARDALKFLSALMPADGETSVLFKDNKTLNEMLSRSYSFREDFPGIAHGFFEYNHAVRTLGHGGNTAAFSAQFTIAPSERFALVVMTNQAGETSLCFGLTKELFGGNKTAGKSELFPDAGDFAGAYIMARKAANGFTNLIMSVSMMMPVKVIDKNTINIAGAKFIQINPYIFKNTGGNPLLDIVDLLCFEQKDGKVIRASIGYFDLLPVSACKAIIIYVSIILLALCVMYVIAAIIISIIGAVRNRKKGAPLNSVKKLNIALYCSAAAAVINNTILTVRVMNYSTYSSLSIHFVINILYAVFAPVCIGFMAVNWKKEPSRAGKVFNIFTMSFSLALAVILIAWEFWR
ncbi:MAG: beta-lactamase family protein [Treponema sp.]|nr:beta-lactamase family protein [Treponema sp.]